MQGCWQSDPHHRPDFQVCKNVIGAQLKMCSRRWFEDLEDLLNDKSCQKDYSSLRKSLIDLDNVPNTEKDALLMKTIVATPDDNKTYYNCPTLSAEQAV